MRHVDAFHHFDDAAREAHGRHSCPQRLLFLQPWFRSPAPIIVFMRLNAVPITLDSPWSVSFLVTHKHKGSALSSDAIRRLRACSVPHLQLGRSKGPVTDAVPQGDGDATTSASKSCMPAAVL